MNKETRVKQTLMKKTSNQGLLSFAGGVKNVIGARKTGSTIRFEVANGTETDEVIYFAPSVLLGGNPTAGFIDGSQEFQRMPQGSLFSTAAKGEAPNALTVKSLNHAQEKTFLASHFSIEPTQITKIAMRSFAIDGVPENTNYGNDITGYFLSPFKEPLRKGSLNFSQFQGPKDTSTEMLTVDLVDQNFDALISQQDVFAMTINAKTKMTITMSVGARLSQPELFHRMVKAGSETIREHFAPGEDCHC
ncbi:hypothetical protein [Brumimicrobium mesophilum]|uniref:hypothetical protein n=1 Tax=Brumimicrobium mesophilum TaxID=392717 RepID=UPI000D143397|nr:hypothetical protein [Brumimicrobium mesophilum]